MSMNEAVKAYGDERAAQGMAQGMAKGMLKAQMEIIPRLLKMGMSLEEALEISEMDEKTYRENLAKYADKN